MSDPNNVVIEQLRAIRAENADRDRQFMLVRAELATLRAEVQIGNSHLREVIEMLSEHSTILSLLTLQLDKR